VERAEALPRDDGSPRAITPAAVAAARDTSPERLRRQLAGDLDAIVLMALRKEPGRRYGTADQLARDVRRYLDSRPVQAHGGSYWDRARKLLRRHRMESAAAALVAAALLGGAGLAARQASLARRERDGAERARQQSAEVTDFVLRLLGSYDPAVARGALVTGRDLLRLATARARDLEGQPLLQARLLEVIGRVHRQLGQVPEARAALERSLSLRRRALGDTHIETVGATYHLADALRAEARYADAERLARDGLAARARNPAVGFPDASAFLAQIAGLRIYRGDVPAAESLARRALALRQRSLRSDDTLLAGSLEYLGATLRYAGKTDEAVRCYREGIALRERVLGPGDPSVGYALLRLGDIYAEEMERYAEAERLYDRAVPIMRAALGVEIGFSLCWV
jgi:serine/threonine-protein kinase